MCNCVECVGYSGEAGEEAQEAHDYEMARRWYINASVREIAEFVVSKNICPEFGDTVINYAGRVIEAKARELANTMP